MGNSIHYELDWKDKKIIRELDINARQSFADIAQKTGLSKDVVVYRVNNMLKTGMIKQFISFIDIQRLGYTFYDVFFKLKHYSADEEKGVIEQIKDLPEVGWFISVRGEWRLIVCVMAKDPAEFNQSLAKVLKILGNKLIRYDFFIVLDAYQLPYKEVLGEEQYTEQTHLGKKESIELKDADVKILSHLAFDARAAKTELVEKTGLTLEMVRHAIKKLEKSGLIQAYKPLLDVEKAGYSWHLMLFQFNYFSDKEMQEFMTFLRSQQQVFYIVKGVGNWSLMVEFHTKTLEEFSAIQEKINSKFEKIIGNEAVMQVTKEHKCVFYPST
jgi:Lrp/AsnC family transcriptional regulator for asnA, asnC and gidA